MATISATEKEWANSEKVIDKAVCYIFEPSKSVLLDS